VPGVDAVQAIGHLAEPGLERLELAGGGPQLGRVAVDEVLRVAGLAELQLADVRAERGPDLVALGLDGARRTVQANIVQDAPTF
jgi:hypothetical protein